MRPTFWLLLLCLPLSAGDRSPLTRAVKAFANDDADVRRNASREVREFLEAELAPLIKAMQSSDPEVRRRAREAIAGLLPEKETSAADGIPGAVINQVGWVQLAQGGNQIRFWVQKNGRLVMQGGGKQQQLQQKQKAEIKRFGLVGYACSQQLVRKQLGLAAGRGYVVAKVTARSVASKFGLQPDDIILSIDGKAVMQPVTLHRAIGAQAEWAKHTVRVMRAGKLVNLGR